MEGVGDEVLLFGAATVVGAVMLYYAVISFGFKLVNSPMKLAFEAVLILTQDILEVG